METVIANRIRSHYQKTNFLSQFQHGFRRHEGVDELLAVLQLKWAKLIQRKHVKKLAKHLEPVIHAIFLDMEKAFDKLGLLYKLHERDICGQVFQWNHCMLKLESHKAEY